MNIERPGSPPATTVATTSKRRSTSIETKRSRPASERPPKKGVASKNAFRSGELTAIDLNVLPLPAAASGPSPTGRIYDKYLHGGAGLQIEQADRPDHCAEEAVGLAAPYCPPSRAVGWLEPYQPGRHDDVR